MHCTAFGTHRNPNFLRLLLLLHRCHDSVDNWPSNNIWAVFWPSPLLELYSSTRMIISLQNVWIFSHMIAMKKLWGNYNPLDNFSWLLRPRILAECRYLSTFLSGLLAAQQNLKNPPKNCTSADYVHSERPQNRLYTEGSLHVTLVRPEIIQK